MARPFFKFFYQVWVTTVTTVPPQSVLSSFMYNIDIYYYFSSWIYIFVNDLAKIQNERAHAFGRTNFFIWCHKKAVDQRNGSNINQYYGKSLDEMTRPLCLAKILYVFSEKEGLCTDDVSKNVSLFTTYGQGFVRKVFFFQQDEIRLILLLSLIGRFYKITYCSNFKTLIG